MIKIAIKSIFGSVLFEHESKDNTIKETLVRAVEKGADLRGAYLQGAYLRGADLQRAKIKTAMVFTGLYTYIVIPYITEKNEHRVKMGCYDRTVKEWDEDFWNNNNEFPNDGSMNSEQRLLAYQTAKSWLKLSAKELEKTEANPLPTNP